MQPSSPTPGYVYVLAHPELPAWFKVGRTYRPPHARAQELSRTAWPSPMEVVHARFFWDSVTAERATHHLLSQHGRRREFFDASLLAIQAAIQSLPITPLPLNPRHPQPIPEWDAPWQARVGDADSWSADPDRREDEWEQGMLETNDASPLRRAQGWRRWMRLSAEGWPEGSRRLADALFNNDPTLQGGHRASWVYDAAAAQGLEGAALRAAWLRSWGNALSLTEWEQSLREAWRHLRSSSWETWPELTRETLLIEKSMCSRLPAEKQAIRVHAAQAFGGWDQVPSGEGHP